MEKTRHETKLLFLLVCVFAALFAFGCANLTEAAGVDSPAPTATPQPDVIHVEVIEIPRVENSVMPSPTPTPEPTPTPIPFSLYAPTVDMTYEELVGSTDDMTAKARDLLKDGYPDPKTYYIIVDKYWQVTLVYKRIDDGTKFGKPDYDQPVRYMLCSTGDPTRENGHETTSGIWPIEKPKERFWQFVNMEAAQYLTLIHSRTYFHSVLYKKVNNLSTLVQQSYDDLGKKASHACIRLTVPDARWMFYNIGYGTACEIRNGGSDDLVTAAIRAQLVLPASKSNPVLDPQNYPWTDNWSIADVAHELEYKYQKPPIPDMGDGADEDTSDGFVTDDSSVEAPDPSTTGGDGSGGSPEIGVTP